MKSDSVLFRPEEFVTVRRPYVEGNNVGTWIGFKHVTYLAQEAVLDWLRAHQLAPGTVFEAHGLATEVVGCRLRLLKPLRVDDAATVVVRPVARPGDRGAEFDVALFHGTPRADGKIAQGRFTVAWRPVGSDLGAVVPPPADLLPFLAEGTGPRPALPPEPGPDGLLERLRPAGKVSVGRCRRVMYPLCAYTERMQFSAYVRLLEEIVDDLLAERGISIGTLLRERRWIPVVSRVEFTVREPVFLEETLYCVFSIEDVVKNLIFTGRMDCHVWRDGRLLPTAECAIEHAYLQFATRAVEATVAPLDARVAAALLGSEGHP
jgi:acyl-CoA thioesterase FadM